jgi:hypothetical protein
MTVGYTCKVLIKPYFENDLWKRLIMYSIVIIWKGENRMPQSERAEIIRKILSWLATHEHGATTQALYTYTQWEICEGGATTNTMKKYIEDLNKGLLIEYKPPFWKITNAGKMWLERHGI